MDNFFSNSKTNQHHSIYQTNHNSQSEHKQYGSIQSTSHSKTYCKNLLFSIPVTPLQSRVQTLNRFSINSHQQQFNQILMKLKNMQTKAQRLKQNNHTNFTQFKRKINNMCKTHQKYCQNSFDLTCS